MIVRALHHGYGRENHFYAAQVWLDLNSGGWLPRRQRQVMEREVKRWMLVVAWFVLQFVWNFLTKSSYEADHLFISRCFVGVAFMLAPIQIIASILAMFAIGKIPWKRKPVA
jgi:hypothetical protein